MSSALDKLAARAAAAAPTKGGREIEIPLAKIKFDPNQPRKAFHQFDGRVEERDEAYIAELAEAIKERGLIQAITVQELPDGTFLVVVGECRTRAHLLLGKSTIRATVRNDLTDANARMLFQVSENLNRKDLTDDELAGAIRDLMTGSGDTKPMTQAEISRALGKSEGWIVRFVKYGDAELQARWRATGVVDSPENLYRVSILPPVAQLDILRRVELPESHSEWLKKPLLRTVIDGYAQRAKDDKAMAKARAADDLMTQAAGLEVREQQAHVTNAAQTGEGSASDASAFGDGALDKHGVAKDDVIGQAFAASTVQASTPALPNNAALASKVIDSAQFSGHQLPEGARAEMLANLAAIPTSTSVQAGELVKPPVNCRVSLVKVAALLKTMAEKNDLSEALDGVPCSLTIPGPLAQLLANHLAGVIVNEQDVPSTIQGELAKLG